MIAQLSVGNSDKSATIPDLLVYPVNPIERLFDHAEPDDIVETPLSYRYSHTAVAPAVEFPIPPYAPFEYTPIVFPFPLQPTVVPLTNLAPEKFGRLNERLSFLPLIDFYFPLLYNRKSLRKEHITMAGTLNTPDVLTQPIANNGTKNQIPNTNDQSLGLMSQSTGFPAICSERIADGGKAPRRADFNGAFNLVSQHHFFLQNGGTETFRQSVSDAIGGYPLNSRLWFTNANGESVIVRSLIANNTYNFNNDPSYIDGIHWVVDVESGAPVGSLMPYAGTTPPDGWLICDGSEISRTTYARLFSVIGTTYGAGDGNSSFNIPNGKTAFGTTIPVRGNGMTLGLTDGTNYGGMRATDISNLIANTGSYGRNIGSAASGPNINYLSVGITQDASKSGIVADISAGATVIIKY